MSQDNKEESNNKIISEIIDTSSEVGGGIGGAIIGGLIAGPPGAIIGGASGPILTRLFAKAGKEIKERVLGNREEIRIAHTYSTGWYRLKYRLEKGDTLREDDFFDSDEINRSAADEILEGVIRSAQSEYQERKLRFYGNLLANISFDASINREKANLFLNIAQNLSYRQLCILQYMIIEGQIKPGWGYHFNHLQELKEYSSLEPLVERMDQYKLLALVRTSGNTINAMEASRLAKELALLMNLDEIDQADIDSVKENFIEVGRIIKEHKKTANKT